jgi:hypothetical protein
MTGRPHATWRAGSEGRTKIGIEKGRPKNDGTGESYPDRNTIAAVITPDRKDWHTVEQVPRPAGPVAGDSAVVVPIAKPVWAS